MSAWPRAETDADAPRCCRRRGGGRLPAPDAGRDRGRPRPDERRAARGRTSCRTRSARSLERIAQRLRGEYPEDEWGFDEQFAEAVYPLFEFLYEVWWRVEAERVRNVPAHGRALLVANHAGSLFPFDASMILRGDHEAAPAAAVGRGSWSSTGPSRSRSSRPSCAASAASRPSPHNATRLLEQDELVMVFPEGVKGTGKPFSERYRLQRFGRGGFVEVALRTGAPIVPVAVVGSEEIYPKLGEAKPLARAIGAPFVPITPTFPWLGPLGLVPLPSKWRIEFCEPIDLSEYGPDAAEDRRLAVRPLRAGPGDDPGDALREPGQARLGVSVASSRVGQADSPKSCARRATDASPRAPSRSVR